MIVLKESIIIKNLKINNEQTGKVEKWQLIGNICEWKEPLHEENDIKCCKSEKRIDK